MFFLLFSLPGRGARARSHLGPDPDAAAADADAFYVTRFTKRAVDRSGALMLLCLFKYSKQGCRIYLNKRILNLNNDKKKRAAMRIESLGSRRFGELSQNSPAA